jgi:hypothetical protein
MVDALAPDDPRVEHKFTEVGGFKYHYMLAKPNGKPTATVFLIHGWYGSVPSKSFCGSSLVLAGQISAWDGATRSLSCSL